MAATPDFSTYAFISIGANLPSNAGDPRDTISRAIDKLAYLSAGPVLTSSLYVTSPVDSPAGTPDFYNAMAAIVPGGNESPLSLLDALQAIENDAGRTRSGVRNEARTLDLDIIVYRTEEINVSRLVVPHPRATGRRFVMQPLVEIAGRDFVVPGTGKSAGAFLDVIQGQEIRRL